LWRLERSKVAAGRLWVARGRQHVCVASDGACGRRRAGHRIEGSVLGQRICGLVPVRRTRRGRATLGAVGLSNARSGGRRRHCRVHRHGCSASCSPALDRACSWCWLAVAVVYTKRSNLHRSSLVRGATDAGAGVVGRHVDSCEAAVATARRMCVIRRRPRVAVACAGDAMLDFHRLQWKHDVVVLLQSCRLMLAAVVKVVGSRRAPGEIMQ
jgi:hypothetical protein